MSGALLFLLLGLFIASSRAFIVRSTKIGEMHQKNLHSIIECFERHSKQNKRVFAQTQGNIAKLYDENGEEIICTEEPPREEPRPKEGRPPHYDQHCFFSPLNCFFTKLRLNKQPRE